MNKIAQTYTVSQTNLIAIGERVVEKMENNPGFPTPPAALAELKKLLPELQVALKNALGRDKEMVSIKNDKKELAIALLRELSAYVTTISKEDRTLMLSSGFDVTSDSRNSSPAPLIEKMEIVQGVTGEATIRVKSATGVKAYIHQYTTEPPGENTIWVQEGSSKRNHTFKGLSLEKRHWFRVVGIGFNGQNSYSPVVTKIVE